MGLDKKKTTVNALEGVDVYSLYDFEGLLGSFAEQQSHIALIDRIEREMGEAPCTFRPEAFFADIENVGDIQAAKKLCQTCPVMMQCAEHAIRFNIPDGVWGGTSAGERKQLRYSNMRKHRRRKAKENGDVEE